jgi:hypothetical protein
MIVKTSLGPTNTNGGEILDLSPLRYKPRKAVRRPVRRYSRKDEHVLNSWHFIALASTLGMWISLTS